jgi:Ran GTPase-activating protein (RanGAP) involved in mRNA processing and transport
MTWRWVIEMLCKNKNVRTLLLWYSNFDLECARLLASALPFCSSLTDLSLQECKIGINSCYAIVKALSENLNDCHLESLNICQTMNNDSGDVEMKKVLADKFVLLLESPYTKLKCLNLSHNKLGEDFVTVFVTGLKHNVRLEQLYLSGNDITSMGGTALANVLYYNQTLTCLDLKNNSMGDDGAIAISIALRYHPKMGSLDFVGNCLTRGGQKNISMF